MKKIGILGGTFDPIHFGHLNLAFELMEKRGLDSVWFIPAKISPHKQNLSPTPFQDRLNMLKVAIEDIPQFRANDIEGHLPSPSYTFNTLQALIKQDQGVNQFYLLMGEDSIPGFFNWHRPEDIIKLTPLLIGSRSGIWQGDHLNGSSLIKEAIQKGLTQTTLMDISGTHLRERLAQGLYCGHLIPQKVLDYLKSSRQ